MYDYLVVGSGLYGAIFAHEAKAHGKSVLVVDKRPNIAGNIYTENIEGINVHKYGAHIFHTNNKKVWNYITKFAEFNRFTNSPVANYKGELYSLPFNMYTFNKMWGVVTPEEAAAKIEEQRKEITHEPQNLEEQAISLVGRDIYEKLIKGYTEKQWGRDCKDLPAFIIKRLPVRLTFDNNYFNALYQGIPIGGYTKMIANLLDGIEVRLNTDYLANKAELDALAEVVGVRLHRQAVHADCDRLFLRFVVLVVLAVAVVTRQPQHAVGNEVLAGAVGFHDGLNQVFRHIGVVRQQLLGVLGQAVAAVAEAGIVVVAADARIQADAVDDLPGVQALALGVGVQLVEVGHTQRQIGVGKQLDGLGLGKAHEQRVDVFLDGTFL